MFSGGSQSRVTARTALLLGEEILDLIAEQHGRGLTIVMVTHDPAIARRADRIVQLHDGRVTDG